MRPLPIRTALVAIVVLAVPAAAHAVVPPPPRERVVNTYPSLPASVTHVEGPAFSADGSRIIAAARSSAFSGTQIVSFKQDGSGYRCLTCGAWTGDALSKPYAFNDGRRILARIGQQSPLTSADHGVVECAPSVADCRTATVVPIEVPSTADSAVVQDQREFRIAPDNHHVAFTQVRKSRNGRQMGVGIFGKLVRAGDHYAVTGARVVGVDGELKSFAPDGQAIYFTRFTGGFDANNPDDVRISLRDGSERRATSAADWDEDIAAGPARFRRRGWIVVGSARGTGELETLGRLRRPLAIEYGTSSLNFVIFIGPESSEPWLADEYDARRGYIGQPLAPGAIARGWDSRPTYRWSPTGNAIVFWQSEIGGTRTRVVVSHLTQRKPVEPKPARTSPTPKWAPRLAGFVPPNPPRPRSRPGKLSGRLTVSLSRSPNPDWALRIVVRYRNFSDSRGWVLNGREISDYDPADGPYGAPCLYSADVKLSGRHRGYLRATDVKVGTQSMDGTIRSALDGRRLSLGPLPR
jgi:hypothetical protein